MCASAPHARLTDLLKRRTGPQIVEGNLKALESLAMVGLVPKVMTILETRGAWDDEAREEEAFVPEGTGGRAASQPSKNPNGVVVSGEPRRKGSGGGGGGSPKVCRR